jgi:hypothetical protein
MTMYTQNLAKALAGVIVASSLVACSVPARPAALPAAKSAVAQPLGPGDTLGQMTLTTGSDRAVSIWTICHPATSLYGVSQTECQVPSGALAIGPTAASLAEAANGTPWEQLQWTLLLDDQPVDLDAFGTFTFRQSQKGPAGRDAYYLYPAWDVVVAQPTVGRHTLRAVVQGLGPSDAAASTGQAEWLINFTVQASHSNRRGLY